MLRKNLVKQQVNHNARHRDIHPERPRPARNPFVRLEAAAQPAQEADDDHWNDGDCQNGVAGQQRDVNRAEPGGVEKARRAAMKMVRDVGVVGDIADQK